MLRPPRMCGFPDPTGPADASRCPLKTGLQFPMGTPSTPCPQSAPGDPSFNLPLGVPGLRLSDRRAIGSCDLLVQVPADGDRFLIVAAVDAPAVLNELRLVSPSRVPLVTQAVRRIPRTHHPRV